MSGAQEVTVSTTTEVPAAAAPVADDSATTVEGTSTVETGIDRDEKGKFRNPAQPRIDELTRARREAEREASYWRTRAEANAKPAPEPPKKPTQDQFADYGEFVEALADWKADEKVNAKLAERDKASAAKQAADKRTSTWLERSTAAAAAIPDLDKVLSNSDVPVAEHVTTALLDSELGPQIAYHLATHPEIAEKLNGMTERQVDREIGRLEATLGTVAADPKPDDAPSPEPTPVTPARRTTTAPPPVKPVAQARSGAVDLAKASMDDYVAARTKQGASWAR